jgi:tetratricopeptide (TPR) repeat protein
MVAQPDSKPINLLSRLRTLLAARWATSKYPRPVAWAIGGMLCAVLIGALVLSLITTRSRPTAQIETAWEHLKAEEYAKARNVATQYLTQNRGKDLPQVSDAAFIIGQSLCGEADVEWNEERKQGLYLVASRYLQESYNRTMPVGHELECLHSLARSTFLADRATASLPYWTELLELARTSPDLTRDCNYYLGKIYLGDSVLDEDRGLEFIDSYLACEDLTLEERSLAIIDRAELLLRSERWDEGLAAIDSIAAPDLRQSRRLLLKGRIVLAKTMAQDDRGEISEDEVLETYRPAIEAFKRVSVDLDDSVDLVHEASYFLATCYGRVGDLDQAISQFSELRRIKLTDPLGWAAGIEEAYFLVAAGRTDEAATSLLAVLEQMSKRPEIEDFWVPVDEMSKRIGPVIQQLVDDVEFKKAEEIAKQMWPPLPRADALLWQAKVQEQWGGKLLEEAKIKTDERMSDALETKMNGLQHLRDAGLAYFKLARLRRDTTYYDDYLWMAADAYLRGHDFNEAIRLYETLLQENIPERIARLYYKMGEAYLLQGEPAKALVALNRCVEERPTDPDTYAVRLLASRIHLKRNEVEEARQLLIDNLEQEALTPKSLEWRESLFELGRVLFRDAALLEAQSRLDGVDSDDPQRVDKGLNALESSHVRFQEAILRLNEAVQRYKAEVPTFEHRYLLAEAYRQSAKWPAKKSLTVTVTTTRYRLQEQAREYYQRAHEVYDELLSDLSREQDRRPLTDMERRILRNTYFVRADMLFELHDYPAAIDAYSSAANQYNQQPESLEAFLRIASCYRLMDRYSDARGVLEQAKLFLTDRIPPDADFENTTRYSRDEWIAFLDVVVTL